MAYSDEAGNEPYLCTTERKQLSEVGESSFIQFVFNSLDICQQCTGLVDCNLTVVVSHSVQHVSSVSLEDGCCRSGQGAGAWHWLLHELGDCAQCTVRVGKQRRVFREVRTLVKSWMVGHSGKLIT